MRQETEDFEAIEQAVTESPRGRWFLSEYTSRLRTRETAAIVTQVKSLEAAIAANHDAIMARLAQALGQQSVPAAVLPAPELAPRHMKFFKQDEDIFEAAPQAAIAAVPAADSRGARLTITRMDGAEAPSVPPYESGEPASMLPQAAEPATEAPPKRRIVIIRHKPGEEIEVPLQNDMAATG